MIMNNVIDFWRSEWDAVADTSEVTGIDDAEIVFCRIHNDSDYNVYYKPEDGNAGERNKVKPHTVHWQKVDGIATCLHKDMVYKIPGKGVFHPSVWIDRVGNVTITDMNKKIIEIVSKPGYKYGWLTLEELDDNWESLFELASKIPNK